MRISYLDSTSRRHDQTLLGWLLRELSAAEVFLANSGYFDGTILDWLEDGVAAVLARGGEAHFSIGSNQGQTAKADLERLLATLRPYMPAHATLSVVYIPGAIYHPKVYYARGRGTVSALVGSPNLTAASGTVNIETAILLQSDRVEPPLDTIEAANRPAAILALPNAYSVSSARDLDLLANLGVIDVPRPVTPRPTGTASAAAVARARRRLTRFPAGARIIDTPVPTARRPATVVRPAATAPVLLPPPAPAASIVVFVWSRNDLKQTGTSEFSVPEGIRTWAGSILGAPIRAGQGPLMHVNLRARLAATPNSVETAPERVRLWSSGASGGTHADVRLLLGNHLRTALEDQAVALLGQGLKGGDIGVFELPADPETEPLRLTVYRPLDPDYTLLDAMAILTGRQRKRQAVVTTLPLLPPWPY